MSIFRTIDWESHVIFPQLITTFSPGFGRVLRQIMKMSGWHVAVVTRHVAVVTTEYMRAEVQGVLYKLYKATRYERWGGGVERGYLDI